MHFSPWLRALFTHVETGNMLVRSGSNGGVSCDESLEFDFDPETRTIVDKCKDRAWNKVPLCRVAGGLDAHRVNTGEPDHVSVFDWYIGSDADIEDLRKAEAA